MFFCGFCGRERRYITDLEGDATHPGRVGRADARYNREISLLPTSIFLASVAVGMEDVFVDDEPIGKLKAGEILGLNAERFLPKLEESLKRLQTDHLDIWQEPLAVGHALLTMPLWLPGSLSLPVALEATYDRTCREQRIGADAA